MRGAQAVAPEVPVIVLTGLQQTEKRQPRNLQDYLIKGQIESRALPRALRHAIERHRIMETDLIRTNQLQFKDDFSRTCRTSCTRR